MSTRLNAYANKRDASERRHVADKDHQFAIEARRNRMTAEWAAPLLGLDTAAYVLEVIEADLATPGDRDVVGKLLADFAARGVAMSEEQLREKMSEFESLARRQDLEQP